jgi:succinoglycan biosynthesis protein ExoU
MTAPAARPTVSVIIAAFEAEGSIARAVSSALAEGRTAEVLVIDDASRDGTARCVSVLAKADPRVRLITLRQNGGPARARNVGIDAASAPLIAMLDADDAFLPGRLDRLCALRGVDLVADDVAFVRSGGMETDPPPERPGDTDAPLLIDAAAFARGNLSGPRRRGELGFLKPVVSRAFLDRNGLRYDETLRLGEDLDLYLRALLAGGRFAVLRRIGYCATVRGGSLSSAHGAEELARLHEALVRQAVRVPGPSPGRAALDALARQVRQRRDHRRFLDLKATGGLTSALRFAISGRDRAGPILRDVLRDKLRRRPVEVIPPGAAFRTLLQDQPPGVHRTSCSGGRPSGSGSSSPCRSSTRIRRAPGR